MHFNLPAGYTIEQLKAAQAQLKIDARLVCDIFDNYGIKYCLAFGSLLGAVRHGGFIPWDDDLDLFVFDEYYDQAMELLKQKLPENLIVHSLENDPNYYHCWNRIKNLNTTVTSAGYYHSDNNFLKYKCLSVDLYRLPLMQFSKIPEYLEREAIDFWDKKFHSGLISEDEKKTGIKNVDTYVSHKMDTISGLNFKANQLIRYFCMKMKTPVSFEYFDELYNAPFEDFKFCIPKAFDVILASMFDDFQTIPDINLRQPRLTSYIKH